MGIIRKSIADCLLQYIQQEKLEDQVVLISMTLAFGVNSTGQEIGELLLGLLTRQELERFKSEEHSEHYIFNPAEYRHYEIASECIEQLGLFQGLTTYEKATYLHMAKRYLSEIKLELHSKLKQQPFIYIHDLDDDDVEHIIHSNFSHEEQQLIKNDQWMDKKYE
jgi:hypothetical protein